MVSLTVRPMPLATSHKPFNNPEWVCEPKGTAFRRSRSCGGARAFRPKMLSVPVSQTWCGWSRSVKARMLTYEGKWTPLGLNRDGLTLWDPSAASSAGHAPPRRARRAADKVTRSRAL